MLFPIHGDTNTSYLFPSPTKINFKLKTISLLNTLCKLLEKIINLRLTRLLENYNLFYPIQNAFRRHRSVLNNLLIIKKEIQTSVNKKQNLGMISFDIAKTYDTAWSLKYST